MSSILEIYVEDALELIGSTMILWGTYLLVSSHGGQPWLEDHSSDGR